MALCAALAMGLGLLASPAEAAPFAFGDSNVSVIDTATNMVVATVPVGFNPFGVAVTPDGTRAYVANENSSTVSAIDTASNMVVATARWVVPPLGSPSRRMGNTPMSRTKELSSTTSR